MRFNVNVWIRRGNRWKIRNATTFLFFTLGYNIRRSIPISLYKVYRLYRDKNTTKRIVLVQIPRPVRDITKDGPSFLSPIFRCDTVPDVVVTTYIESTNNAIPQELGVG